MLFIFVSLFYVLKIRKKKMKPTKSAYNKSEIMH